MLRPTARKIDRTKGKPEPIRIVPDDYYPRWISEQDQRAEALIAIGDQTKVTQIQINDWPGNALTLIGREDELVNRTTSELILAKRVLAEDLKNVLRNN